MYEARQNKEKVSRRSDRGGGVWLTQRVNFEDGRVNNVTQLMCQPIKTATVSNNFQTVQFSWKDWIAWKNWKDRIRHGVSIVAGGIAYNATDYGASKIGIPIPIIQTMLQGALDSSTAAFVGLLSNKLISLIPLFKNEDSLENRVTKLENQIRGLPEKVESLIQQNQQSQQILSNP